MARSALAFYIQYLGGTSASGFKAYFSCNLILGNGRQADNHCYERSEYDSFVYIMARYDFVQTLDLQRSFLHQGLYDKSSKFTPIMKV